MSDSLTFNPMSAAFAADPYAVYRVLRARAEPYYWAELDMVMVSRYADISQVALDPNAVRSLVGFKSPKAIAETKRKSGFDEMPFHERFVQTNLLDRDGAEHGRLRQLVFGAFTGRSIARMEADITRYVGEILTRLPGGETVDFIDACASQLPGLVIGRFLGVPEADAAQLRRWSDRIVDYFNIDKTPQKKQLAEAAVRELHDYLVALKRARTRAPKADLISQMIAQETSGLYQPDEMISTCMLILMAGHGSTIDVIGSGLYTLLEHPDALSALRRDRALLPGAIEEMFRYEPPLPFFHRHAVQDIVVGGQRYPAGTTFGLLYASANRDESVFPDADVFNIRRSPNRHLSFGRGAHLCLGNHLAKLNMRVLFEQMLTRFDRIELAGDVTWKRGLSARGLEALPIRLRS